jgi:hypothetical protein
MRESLFWEGGGGRNHNRFLEGSQIKPTLLKPEFNYLAFKAAVHTQQKTPHPHYEH